MIRPIEETLPGAVVIPGYTSESSSSKNTKVWEDRGKLFVRIPVENDHPLQVEIDTLSKKYEVYGAD